MLCKRCNTLMKETIRFENGKSCKLFKCPECHKEIKVKNKYPVGRQETRKSKWEE